MRKMRRKILIAAGIALNVILSFAMDRLGLPLFLDTAGSIGVAVIGGMLPGIFTAVSTNVICTLFNESAVYFAAINALLAIYASWFFRKNRNRSASGIISFIVSISLLAGVTSTFIQWGLFGEAQHTLVTETARSLSRYLGMPFFATFLVTNIIVNILDKSFATGVTFLVLRIIPADKLAGIEKDDWMQRPLSDDEIRSMKEWGRDVKYSVRKRTAITLVSTSLLLVIAMGWIAVHLYYNNEKEEKTEAALSAVRFAAGMINADRVDDYLSEGREAFGYNSTEEMLGNIRQSVSGIEYLYVLKIEETGCRFIFDPPADNNPDPYEPGESVPFEAAFEPYVPYLLAGEEIDPIESNDRWGWMQTVYYPVRNENGNTVCYVGADVSLSYMAGYTRDFVLKVMLLLAGFFILVISYTIWTTSIYTSYPISSIAACVDRFANSGDDQEKLDENVRSIRALDIRTGDEIEKMYLALCRMTSSQAENLRDIRRLSESTAKMQDGLIVTMADMVESRDSDTGAHVQKTSAYVKIIVEGLKKHGYYSEKITEKFISDIVRSAPLHDVGKINIPDGVLNKPGKLTDEEFEIMKTHTTAGKKIMENAISTVQGENYLKEARNMAAYHHERWDGKGYPDGLAGEVIPLSARIMSVADVFDALTSPRVYKPAFPLDKALSILNEGAGTQFDPKCIEVFMDALPEVKVILKKYNQTVF